MHLLKDWSGMKICLRKNDYFLTRIIDYNIFGGIDTLLLHSRAAPGMTRFYQKPRLMRRNSLLLIQHMM